MNNASGNLLLANAAHRSEPPAAEAATEHEETPLNNATEAWIEWD